MDPDCIRIQQKSVFGFSKEPGSGSVFSEYDTQAVPKYLKHW